MWSKKYEKCIICGTTERKHKGNGRCVNCYQKKQYKINPEKSIKRSIKYQKENPEKVNKKNWKWRRENPEKYKEYRKKWYSSHKKDQNERTKEWQENNKEKCRKYSRDFQKANKEKGGIYRVKYLGIKENREKNNKRAREYVKEKRKNNPGFKLRLIVSSSINGRLKKRLYSKNGKRTWDFLPYTVDELMQHLENLFQSGMTWENHTFYGWHIDHIRPDCSFNYKNVEDKEFQECWSLKNLQPLWWRDNLKKNGKSNY